MAAHSQAIGKSGEDILSTYHEFAANQGVAFFWKVPTPTCWRKGSLVYAERSITDYVGTMLDGSGRSIAEEAKRTMAPRFSMTEVKEHQRAFLDRTDRAGAVALLSVVDAKGALYTFDWSVIRDCTSFAFADVPGWRVATAVDYLRRHLRRKASVDPR